MITGAIDVHAHFVPPAIVERVQEIGAAMGVKVFEERPGGNALQFDHGLRIRPFLEAILDIDTRRRTMETQGVGCQILSVWADLLAYGMPRAAGIAWHRLLNECLARAIDGAPDRYRMMVSVPLQDAEAAARMFEDGVRTHGAIGVVVGGHVEGVNLGDAPLDPFWATAERLGLPVFLHPGDPTPGPRFRRHGLAQSVSYTTDTSLAVGSLIGAGVLDRFPCLEIILSHGGGGVPYLAGRFDCMHQVGDRKTSGTVAEVKPSSYLRRFHYDTILHAPAPLRFLADLVGADRLLLGTDYPFPVQDHDPVATAHSIGLGAADVARITGGNARALFRL
ncbi:MAG: amidohydrolase [Alphaproteobacteria bacterium]|nr:amidohydrolase [Alphaproteobacteria bacterium]